MNQQNQNLILYQRNYPMSREMSMFLRAAEGEEQGEGLMYPRQLERSGEEVELMFPLEGGRVGWVGEGGGIGYLLTSAVLWPFLVSKM